MEIPLWWWRNSSTSASYKLWITWITWIIKYYYTHFELWSTQSSYTETKLFFVADRCHCTPQGTVCFPNLNYQPYRRSRISVSGKRFKIFAQIVCLWSIMYCKDAFCTDPPAALVNGRSPHLSIRERGANAKHSTIIRERERERASAAEWHKSRSTSSSVVVIGEI